MLLTFQGPTKLGGRWRKGRLCVVWVLRIDWDFITQRRAFQGERLRAERVGHSKGKEGCFAAKESRIWGLRDGLTRESP